MDPKPDPFRVAIVDSEPMNRAGLDSFLQGRPFEVVALYGSAASCLRDHGTQADLVVVGRNLGDMSVLDLISASQLRSKKPRILVVASWEGAQEVVTWLRAGASGYLPTSATTHEVRAAAEAVANRETVLSEQFASEIMQASAVPPSPPDSSTPLTRREVEILELIAAGMDNTEIAARLIVSRYTVKNHVAHILEKLKLDNRVQAAVHAVRLGLA
jgi:DNA-binding NarL/FixJ family response regulator